MASEARPDDLVYPLATPAHGEVLEVADGVLWIRMPLPFKLDHINLWAIREGEGWTVVDTGLFDEQVESTWVTVLREALGGEPIVRVIATHMHADHIGMAGWLTQRFGCPLWITRQEYLECAAMATPQDVAPQANQAFYRRAGWNQQAIDAYVTLYGQFARLLYPLPATYHRIVDGDTIIIGQHEWTVIVGTGHSPEHACLYCPALQLFISGDQVLPKITSNVSVSPAAANANPMAGWLSSLAKIKHKVPDTVLVLPAHNECFRGLHRRLDDLMAIHDKEQAMLLSRLETPHRAVDIFKYLFRREISMSDGVLLTMATGESLANLNYLLHAGLLVKCSDETGIDWYSTHPCS